MTPKELEAVNRWLQARLEGRTESDPPGGAEAKALAERLLTRATGPNSAFEASPLSDPDWLSGVSAGLAEAGSTGTGARVGPFELERAIGAGGMGAVYLARRVEGGFEQTVALKILAGSKPDSESYRQFRREREVLSRLEHPNIARLIDGGMTEDWRPWFAMEYVDGLPIDQFAKKHRLDINERLELFGQVCEAMEYAHRHLVLHRDIKPSNILVSGNGQIKLLDFGLGKTMESLDEAADGSRTQPALRWLTPDYASPEQVGGQTVNVTSEVYQLGVLLYRLLCACPPYQAADTSLKEIVRAVCETDPKRPSEHWRASGDDILSRAACFRSRPETLRRRLTGDLDNIVLTAMAKDPRRRYGSVAELSEDLRRHADHRPVRARAATRRYLLGKFLRRYRAGVATTASVFLIVTGALAVIGWQARVVVAERDVARYEASRWDVMNDQLLLLFRHASRDTGDGELSARELLEGSVEQVEELLAHDPAGRVRVQAMLGALQAALEDFSGARPLLEAFVAADDGTAPAPLRGQVYIDLAHVNLRLGEVEDALESADRALEILEPLPGDHGRRLSGAYLVRGRILRSLGRWAEAIAELERGIELARTEDGAPNRELAVAVNNLAVTLSYAGQTEAATGRFRESLEMWRVLGLGDSHDALNIMGNLAATAYMQGRLDEAEPLYTEAIELRRRRYGASGALAALHNNYGLLLLIRYRLEEAREHLESALEMQRRFAGPVSPDYALSLRVLGLLALAEDHPELAADYFQWAESLFSDALGADHPFTAVVRGNQAVVLGHTESERAAGAFDEAVAGLEAGGPAVNRHLADLLCEQAIFHIDQGEPASALASAQRCRDIREESLPGDAWQHAESSVIMAAAEVRLDVADARERLETGLARLAETYGEGHPRLRWLREL